MPTYENESIEKYANEMPSELRRAMGSLNSDMGLATFFVLFKYGELSFSQIMNELEIPASYSSKLTYHIKKLQKAALVKNEYVKKKDTDSYSFYDITEFGEEIVKNLMNALKVPQAINFPIASEEKSTSFNPINIKLNSNPKSCGVTGNTEPDNQFRRFSTVAPKTTKVLVEQ